MTHSDPLTGLLTIGAKPDDPIAEPHVRPDGGFMLEDGETIASEGDHDVTVAVLRKAGGRTKAGWEQIVSFDKKAHVIFTSQRVLFAWPRWKSDRAAGSFLERRVLASFMEREEGKMLLGGHIRHAWVTRVIASKPKGALRQQSKVRVDVRAEDTHYNLLIAGFEPDAARAAAARFASAVAAARIARSPRLNAKDEETLKAIADGTAAPADIEWAWSYSLPASRNVGRDYPQEHEQARPPALADDWTPPSSPWDCPQCGHVANPAGRIRCVTCRTELGHLIERARDESETAVEPAVAAGGMNETPPANTATPDSRCSGCHAHHDPADTFCASCGLRL